MEDKGGYSVLTMAVEAPNDCDESKCTSLEQKSKITRKSGRVVKSSLPSIVDVVLMEARRRYIVVNSTTVVQNMLVHIFCILCHFLTSDKLGTGFISKMTLNDDVSIRHKDRGLIRAYLAYS